jgi:hypothetical protein
MRCGFFPALLFLTNLAFAAENVLLLSPGSGSVGSSDNVMTVSLENKIPVRAVQLEIEDDPDFLIFQTESEQTTPRTEDFQLALHDSDGILRIILISIGSAISPDTGAIFRFSYRVTSDAREGPLKLNINKITVTDQSNKSLDIDYHNSSFIIDGTTDVSDIKAGVREYNLAQNFPNPFNPQTSIDFSLPESEHVRLQIYNTLGQLIKTLIDERRDAGIHRIQWHGTDESGRQMPAGIYLYRIQTENFIECRQLVLIR